MFKNDVLLNLFRNPAIVKSSVWMLKRRRAASRNDGKMKGFTLCRHSELVSESSKKGFTLIELLVVVLIIGILSAVALPQYQKAVWKSRAAAMLPNLRALAAAQEAYYMANGAYATRYDELDVSFDSLPLHTDVNGGYLSKASGDAVRADKNYKLVINSIPGNFLHSATMFEQGPYVGGGLLVAHYVNNLAGIEPGSLYCYEYAVVKGKLCKPFYGVQETGTANKITYYKM